MGKRGKLIWATAIVALIVTIALARGPLGRTRPDLAAWLAFDDGPLTFSRTYTAGKVGPFMIGDTRAAIIEHLAAQHLPPQDMLALSRNRPEWRVSLPASAGGHVTYTIAFTDDRATSISTFYSVFSGL